MRRRYMVFLGVVAVIAIIFTGITATEKSRKFDSLIEEKRESVAYVKGSMGEKFDTEEFFEEIDKYVYKIYRGKPGSTSHRQFEFYDKNDELLFTLTDLGNRNLLWLTVNGKTVTYRAIRREEEAAWNQNRKNRCQKRSVTAHF